MKTTDNFSKRFLSICAGISLVLLSGAAFMYSTKSANAAAPKSMIQTGTAENYIPLGIHNGYGYWMVYNTSDGYKFRKTNMAGSQWVEK
jgi:hypothetical protein